MTKEQRQKYDTERREKRKMQGICVYCGVSPSAENLFLCSNCREKRVYTPTSSQLSMYNEKQKQRYKSRQGAGVCVSCSVPTAGLRCDGCMKRAKATRDAKK